MYQRTYSAVRKTEIGSMIEAFMDDNSEHLSPYMWEELEVLGDKIDKAVLELENHIDDLNAQIED
jgi:hypothetical protein